MAFSDEAMAKCHNHFMSLSVKINACVELSLIPHCNVGDKLRDEIHSDLDHMIDYLIADRRNGS